MACKRMFSKEILCSDEFLDLPHGAKVLYIYLNLEADDDGFVSKVKTYIRILGSTWDELELLILKNYLIRIEKSIFVIRDWRVHNTLRKDRYSPTVYQEAYAKLKIKQNKQYSLDEGTPLVQIEDDECGTLYVDEKKLSDGNQMATDGCHSKVKYSKGKVSKAKQGYVACIADFLSCHSELSSLDGRFHQRLSDYFNEKQIDEENMRPFCSFVYDNLTKRYENVSPNLFYNVCFEADMLSRFIDSKTYIVKQKLWPEVCPVCGEFHNNLGQSENCTLDMSRSYTDEDLQDAKNFFNLSETEKSAYRLNMFKRLNGIIPNSKGDSNA